MTDRAHPTSWPPAGLDELVAVSARLGADLLLVQGGGGNSSLKTDDLMVVKASGFWLRDALTTPMFVPLDLKGARSQAASGAEAFDGAVLRDLPGGTLRPSIETGLHALMPHAFVFHAHPVGVITASVRADLRRGIPERLAGLRWAFIDYVKPGPELARQVGAALAKGDVDLLLFGNHGAVAGGRTAAEAADLLLEAERRLRVEPASLPAAKKPEGPAPEGYRWLDDTLATALAHAPERAGLLGHGALVPDQVVYLGGPACIVGSTAEVDAVKRLWVDSRGVAPGLVFVAGQGALVRDDLSSGGLSMIGLLCEIALRLKAGEAPATLTLDNELSLLNWEAEKYRQAVDRARA